MSPGEAHEELYRRGALPGSVGVFQRKVAMTRPLRLVFAVMLSFLIDVNGAAMAAEGEKTPKRVQADRLFARDEIASIRIVIEKEDWEALGRKNREYVAAQVTESVPGMPERVYEGV